MSLWPYVRLLLKVRRCCPPGRLYFGHGTDERVLDSIFEHGLGVNNHSLTWTATFLNDYIFLNSGYFPELFPWPFNGKKWKPERPVIVLMTVPLMTTLVGPVQYMCDILTSVSTLDPRDYVRAQGFQAYLPREHFIGAIRWQTEEIVLRK